MTHKIKSQFAPNIHLLQTTKQFAGLTDFDVHPAHIHIDHMQQLQDEFELPHPLIIQQQEHKDRAVEYNDIPTTNFRHRADACFTRQKNTICAVMTADCLPVMLADKNGQWVAAIHCGWRSLFQNIISKTFSKIQANPIYTQAYLGPCIQQPHYEVDEDFVINFTNIHPDTELAFSPIINGKSQANLQEIANIQLHKLGILEIQTCTDCTFEQAPKYPSWRRDQSPQRMATLIWMT
ncbi:peptidoglycan editing factor PgeF [Marinicella rhabdoformis]|uniref:peptidoglycan editing factor PgeF n=1 Tax=Marinicella rhabdoformis TaxID=2580566 RepID=UPI0012AEB733|nr:peptidoglycan editing factor PgeF [Marinicella rhabdoformis]